MIGNHIQRRARRRKTSASLNLVSLMDIFTILVFFLLATSSEVKEVPPTNGVSLPTSTAAALPKESEVLYVKGDEIRFGDTLVMSVGDALAIESKVLPPLYLALMQARPANTPGDQGYRITILADRETSYVLLRKVLTTCAQAKYTTIALATNKVVKSEAQP